MRILVLSVGLSACATAPVAGPASGLRISADGHQAVAMLNRNAQAEIESLTTALVACKTVSALESAKDGRGFAQMAEVLRAFAGRHRLEFRVSGANDAFEVVLGHGPPTVALVAHGDVVPVTAADAPPLGPDEIPPGWSHHPVAAETVDGRLYGRGSEDDKGPIAAALVVLASLADGGYVPRGEIKLVIGNGEESDWDGMERYVAQTPPARFTISIDGEYPVVVGEDGFVVWELSAPVAAPVPSTRARIVSARGGEFLTQVPGAATLRMVPGKNETLEALTARATVLGRAEQERRHGAGRPFGISVTADRAAGEVALEVTGKAVHSSVPEEGANALWPLAALAVALELEQGGVMTLFTAIHRFFDGDDFGVRLGLSYQHPLMGALVVAPDVLRVDAGLATLRINMRRPAGMSREAFADRLAAALVTLQREVDPRIAETGERYVGEPVLVDPESPLVRTLLEVYRRQRREPRAAPHTIRGGTYARLFDGAVSFGPAWPGKPTTAHAADEYVLLEDLVRTASMLIDAVTRLDALPPP
ncbi:MAG: Sapep family Mn(2+)-dependent dipeptidase [Deltaproteobacteria bacterium]|nr:Sapep family Mn(2+)-dependent dipeptidase [Deltaproteobacteria bacterium]